jgi:hypothetical protein
MSHTVKVKVNFGDPDILGAVAVSMGGRILGDGMHRMYGGQSSQGYGIALMGWVYPLVLGADGTLAFDDYGGHWGNRADIDRLTALYAVSIAEQAAQAQGWYCERVHDELVIYHPEGGILRVMAGGVVDTSGFLGADCQAASAPIESALGRTESETLKAEFYGVRAHIQLKGE